MGKFRQLYRSVPILLLLPTTTFRPANIILQPQPQPQQVEDQAGQAARVEDS